MKIYVHKGKRKYFQTCPFCKGKKTCYKMKDKRINGYRIFCRRLNEINNEVGFDINKGLSEMKIIK